jgi:alpha-L-rhamnosidase
MWRVIAGINPDDPEAEGGLLLAPRPGNGLSWARATHHTVRGPVLVHWKTEDGAIVLAVSLPPNVPATVVIPGASAAEVREGGLPLAKAPGVTVLGRRGDGCAVRLLPGSYRFVASPRGYSRSRRTLST